VPDPAEEAEHWRRWRTGSDGAARAALVARYIPFAKSMAARLFARRVGREIEFDDYYQYAMVGLLEAMERFEPERGHLFRTYASTRIQGAILNGLQRLTERQQRYAARQRMSLERVASLIPEALTLEPDDRLVSQLGDIGVSVALSLILEGTGMERAAKENGSEGIYQRAELRQFRDRAWKAIPLLADREQQVIALHYRDGLAFEEVARVLQLSKSRVSQLHRQALERLRELISRARRCDVSY
jgi:RNA polymerase sigma factor for flagellar operon FliA